MQKNEPFRFIGDDYLKLHDTLSKLTPFESVIFNMNNNGLLMGQKEMQYMIGGDKVLRASAEYLMGINRVINSDPEKYKKIFMCQDPRYKYQRRIPIMLPDNKPIKTQGHDYIN